VIEVQSQLKEWTEQAQSTPDSGAPVSGKNDKR